MRILCDTQGTPEWDAARRGRVTASRICDAIRGPSSKTRAAYMLDLVLDWEGVPDFTSEETPRWFQYGKLMEEWARGYYSWKRQVDVRMTGFVVHDEIDWLGCSPDGLIDGTDAGDGLLEVKSHEEKRLMLKAIEKPSPAYLDQVQVQLFVTGRNWCDLLHYWCDRTNDLEDGRIVRIGRDEHRLAYILSKTIAFYTDAQKLLRLRANNTGMLASAV